MRRRVVACFGAVVVLSAVLPTARAHAAVEPGGCQGIRATGAARLAGETVTVWAYERVCGGVADVQDVAVTSLGRTPYRAVVQLWRPGSRGLVPAGTASDGAAATDHVVWVGRAVVGGVVRVVVTAGRCSATIAS